jgi:hypothetical protein
MDFLNDFTTQDYIAIIGLAVGIIGIIVGIIGIRSISVAKKLLRRLDESTPPPREKRDSQEILREMSKPRETRATHNPTEVRGIPASSPILSNSELLEMMQDANDSAPVEIEISKYLTLSDADKQGVFYVIIPDK